MDWYAANERCNAKGMHLVSVLSKEENDFIVTQLEGKIPKKYKYTDQFKHR